MARGKMDVAALQGPVEMVGHEAEGVNTVTETEGSFLQQ